MEAMLPKNIQAGLDAARLDSMRKSSHLHVEADGAQHKVLRFWDTGFSLESATAPQLRGRVDLYDGAAHLCQCLIVAVAQEGDEMIFDFKRATRCKNSCAGFRTGEGCAGRVDWHRRTSLSLLQVFERVA